MTDRRESVAERQWRILAQDSNRDHQEAEKALAWYAEKVAACRKLTPEGDAARAALDRDSGAIARKALGLNDDMTTAA